MVGLTGTHDCVENLQTIHPKAISVIFGFICVGSFSHFGNRHVTSVSQNCFCFRQIGHMS